MLWVKSMAQFDGYNNLVDCNNVSNKSKQQKSFIDSVYLEERIKFSQLNHI